VDDGSTDASPEICREYAARDGRFQLWTQPHGGVVSARRHGVGKASAPLTGFVDADDWAEPELFQMLTEAASGGDAAVCGYFRHKGQRTDCRLPFLQEGVCGGEAYRGAVLEEMLCTRNRSAFDRLPVLWNLLLPTWLIRQTLNGTDVSLRRGEDALCVYTCLLQLSSLVCVKKPLYHYCVHGDSVIGRVGFGTYRDTELFYRGLSDAVRCLQPELLKQTDSLFLYLISLGAGENPSLLRYPEVRRALREERLAGCCAAWKRRVRVMRLKSLTAPRPDHLKGREVIAR